MKVKHFEDTDTALLEFTQGDVAETIALFDDTHADVDKDGNLVSMTIEHARQNAALPEVTYERLAAPA